MKKQYKVDLKDLKRIRKMLTLAEAAIAEIIQVKQIIDKPSNAQSPTKTEFGEAPWQPGYQLNLFEQASFTEKECEF